MFLATGQRPGRRLARAYCSPNGPVTVIVRLCVFRYDVMSFFINRSPIVSSTPGGTESGVLPSFEGRCVVAEKFRRADDCVVWKAGTRKPGSVTVEEGLETSARCRACRPVLGASIVGGGGGLATRDALQSSLLQSSLLQSSLLQSSLLQLMLPVVLKKVRVGERRLAPTVGPDLSQRAGVGSTPKPQPLIIIHQNMLEIPFWKHHLQWHKSSDKLL